MSLSIICISEVLMRIWNYSKTCITSGNLVQFSWKLEGRQKLVWVKLRDTLPHYCENLNPNFPSYCMYIACIRVFLSLMLTNRFAVRMWPLSEYLQKDKCGNFECHFLICNYKKQQHKHLLILKSLEKITSYSAHVKSTKYTITHL